MNDKSSPPRPWRRALFLLPALLAAALIFYTLPRTQPVLAAVPELLEYVPTPAPSAAPKTTLHDGVYTGVGEGYGGEIVLRLTVENGCIVSVEVTEADDETPAYYNRAAALLPLMIERQSAELDAVSGATFSSRGILEAAQSALEQASAEPKPAPAPTPTPTPNPTPTPKPTAVPTDSPTPEETPEPTPEPTPAPKRYRDGAYTATGWCEEIDNFRYEVIVTVTVEDGLIRKVSLEIGQDESDFPEDNDYFIDRAVNGTTKQKGIPDRIVAAQSAEDVDAVSGATYTSQTICRLVTEALRGAEIGGKR